MSGGIYPGLPAGGPFSTVCANERRPIQILPHLTRKSHCRNNLLNCLESVSPKD